MNRTIAPLAMTALLLTGCAGTVEAEPAPEPATTSATPTPTPEPTTEEPKPEPTPEPEPTPDTAKAEAEEQLTDTLTQPEVVPVPAFDPEAAFLATYKEQLQTLPEGPHAQLGTDNDALLLGWEACAYLVDMSYGEVLVMYAFQEGVTEEQVADFNAALNAGPGTLC